MLQPFGICVILDMIKTAYKDKRLLFGNFIERSVIDLCLHIEVYTKFYGRGIFMCMILHVIGNFMNEFLEI